MLLHFVNPDMEVVSTLLTTEDQPNVWSHFPPGARAKSCHKPPSRLIVTKVGETI